MEQKTRTVQRYVDILTEAGFKAVFGVEKNKDVLIDLLNVVLPEHRRVQDLTYSTTELPGFTMANKSVRLDLRCTGEDGAKFIVEMQCYRQVNFFKRCVEYAAKLYDSGSERGDGHEYDLAPVYFIGLLNTDVPKFDRSDGSIWSDRYVSEYTFREKVSREVVDETIFLTFVELHRFDKELHECGSLVDKWCYFKYEHDMITERDYDNIIYTAKIEGRAEGKAEGLAEGEAKGRVEGRAEGLAEGKTDVARAMKTKGLESSLISELTGLSEEEIRKL